MAGGGADAYALFDTLVRAVPGPRANAVSSFVVVTGPFLPARRAAELLRRADGLPIHVIPTRQRLAAATCAPRTWWWRWPGYNTTAEILGLADPALLVPRAGPSAEQQMRASGFRRARLGRTGCPRGSCRRSRCATAMVDALDAPVTSTRPAGPVRPRRARARCWPAWREQPTRLEQRRPVAEPARRWSALDRASGCTSAATVQTRDEGTRPRTAALELPARRRSTRRSTGWLRAGGDPRAASEHPGWYGRRRPARACLALGARAAETQAAAHEAQAGAQADAPTTAVAGGTGRTATRSRSAGRCVPSPGTVRIRTHDAYRSRRSPPGGALTTAARLLVSPADPSMPHLARLSRSGQLADLSAMTGDRRDPGTSARAPSGTGRGSGTSCTRAPDGCPARTFRQDRPGRLRGAAVAVGRGRSVALLARRCPDAGWPSRSATAWTDRGRVARAPGPPLRRPARLAEPAARAAGRPGTGAARACTTRPGAGAPPRPLARLPRRRGRGGGDAAGRRAHRRRCSRPSAQTVRARWPRRHRRARPAAGRGARLTHGDMKCDNLLVDGDRIRILDLDRSGPGPTRRSTWPSSSPTCAGGARTGRADALACGAASRVRGPPRSRWARARLLAAPVPAEARGAAMRRARARLGDQVQAPGRRRAAAADAGGGADATTATRPARGPSTVAPWLAERDPALRAALARLPRRGTRSGGCTTSGWTPGAGLPPRLPRVTIGGRRPPSSAVDVDGPRATGPSSDYRDDAGLPGLAAASDPASGRPRCRPARCRPVRRVRGRAGAVPAGVALRRCGTTWRRRPGHRLCTRRCCARGPTPLRPGCAGTGRPRARPTGRRCRHSVPDGHGGLARHLRGRRSPAVAGRPCPRCSATPGARRAERARVRLGSAPAGRAPRARPAETTASRLDGRRPLLDLEGQSRGVRPCAPTRPRGDRLGGVVDALASPRARSAAPVTLSRRLPGRPGDPGRRRRARDAGRSTGCAAATPAATSASVAGATCAGRA